ncbi:HNH endonuclease [Pseudomonas siliginis]|uniref:HNH endonuclease n=1 Tax=Pseudomonas siliginis TaxID=2842346 RepID=UPI00386F9319
MDIEKENTDWSDEELEAAVDGYLKMLALEKSGQKLNKAHENRLLREGVLKNRSRGSIEFRMRNISTELNDLCLPYIIGYLPAKHLGAGVAQRVRAAMIAKGAFDPDDYSPTADDQALNAKVSRLEQRELVGTPRGIEKPQRTVGTTTSFLRDPLTKLWVLKNANGVCEGCGLDAPFKLPNGLHFLEVHHVQHLANDGPDWTTNAVALCPNCHRRCHYSSDKDEFTESLYGKVKRLKRYLMS